MAGVFFDLHGVYVDLRSQLCLLIREAERRVAKQSPFYMAKYVTGKSLWDGRSYPVWEKCHVEAGVEMWRLWQTRFLRPYGTIYRMEWSRDTRKSAMGQAMTLCIHLDNRNNRALYDSDTWENASKKMGVIKRMYEDSHFQELYGDLRGEMWSEERLLLKRTAKLSDPSLVASGMNAEKTSQHYDFIDSDDTQTDGNSQSPEQINKVKKNFKLYDSLLSRNGMILSLGTRWALHDEGQMIAEMQVQDRRFGRPQRIFINRRSCYGKNEEGKYDEKLLMFPNLLDRETLSFKRASQGAFLFSCNYLCEPMSEETAKVKKEWIRYHGKTQEELKAIGAKFYLAIDPSKEGTAAGRDFDALVVAAVTPSVDIYVMEALALRVDRPKLFENIVRLAAQYPLEKVMIEEVFQQHELKAWLVQQTASVAVRIPWFKFKQDGKRKEDRVNAAQVYFEAKKVWIREDHVELEDQLLRFGKTNVHDDLVDAFCFILKMMSIPSGLTKKEWWLKADCTEDEEFQASVAAKGVAATERNIRFWRTMRQRKESGGRDRKRVSHMGMAA